MVEQNSDQPVLADCGCLRRMETPSPPDLPFEANQENVPKLKDFIINHYNASTMNLCPYHQQPFHYIGVTQLKPK